MNAKIDRGHLRQVRLTPLDIRLLSLLSKSGGEYPMPDTDEGRALVQSIRAKRLVEIVERFGQRYVVRLTDEGRTVVTQLETMAIQPKVEVQSTGVLPPDLKGDNRQ